MNPKSRTKQDNHLARRYLQFEVGYLIKQWRKHGKIERKEELQTQVNKIRNKIYTYDKKVQYTRKQFTAKE